MNVEKRDVFISYHTASSIELVKTLVPTLEKDGVSCWYAPRDCEEGWADAIMEAIDKASIFLIIINKQSIASAQVQNEINAATNRYSKKQIAIIVFRIDDSPISGSTEYYLGRFHMFDGVTPPQEKRLEELKNRIIYTKEHLAEANELSEESRFVSSLIEPDASFVGRKREIETIKEALEKYQHLFVSGMGGIGKSDVVKAFVRDNKDHFRSRMFMSYEGSLLQLINALKITNMYKLEDEDDESFFNRRKDYILANGKKEDLLIIDNFDVEDDPYLKDVLSFPLSIIFTTRINQESYHSINIGPMDDMNDLLELFTTFYPRDLSSEDKEAVIIIIKMLHGHTMAIKNIATYMRENRVSPTKLLEMLKKRDSLTNSQEDINETIYAIFETSLFSEVEKKILVNMLLVPLCGIGVEEFHNMINLSSYKEIDKLIKNNWLSYDISKDIISLHPIVYETIFKKIGYSDDICEDYLKALMHKLDSARSLLAKDRPYLSLMQEKASSVLSKDSKYYTRYHISVSNALHVFGNYKDAIASLNSIDIDKAHPKEKVIIYMDIADNYRCIKDIDNLMKYADIAYKLVSEVEDEYDKNVLKADLLGRYGWYYFYSGEYDKSVEYFIKEKNITVSFVNDEDGEKIGWTYFNIAMPLMGLKRYDDAISYLYKAETYFKKVNSLFSLAHTKKNIGISLYYKGDKEEGIKITKEAIALFLESTGEDHYDTAMAYHDLALELYSSNQKDEALVYEKKAREYHEKHNSLNVVTNWLI